MRRPQLFALVSLAACGSGDIGSSSSAVIGVDAATTAKSTITMRVEEARTDSILTSPTKAFSHCHIPTAVLTDLPIYKGDPAMVQCDLHTVISGDPPTSITIELACDDGTDGWDTRVKMACKQKVTLAPPGMTSSGSFYYGRKDIALTAKACDAYLARALSICETTGVAPIE